MSDDMKRPNVEAVLSTLKDFQRKTVDYVFRRLYLDEDYTRRFLIADEVGLGKTLVAKGVIAKTVDHLWDHTKRIDIVYICSNFDIARQNVNRLNISLQEDFALASRITLLPTEIRNLKDKKLNFVSFTPGTSFDLKSSLGWVWERAVLYHLLLKAWGLRGTGPMNVLEGRASTRHFRSVVRECRQADIDEGLADAFAQDLSKRIETEKAQGNKDIRTRFEDLCERFEYARKHIPAEDAEDRAQIVGELRALLATTCLQALEPDLIILDEFQRFKYLLEGNDEAAQLAQTLFSYCDAQGHDREGARVVLLSATPYKMYTLNQEIKDEDHYQDFVRTLRFLQRARAEEFEQLLAEYRRKLYELGQAAPEEFQRVKEGLRTVKDQLQEQLGRVMVRTERLAVQQDRDGMLIEVRSEKARLAPQDVLSYVGMENVAEVLEQGNVLEYWKSAPYLLNFMDEYKIKQQFEEAVDDESKNPQLAKALAKAKDQMLLTRKDVEEYKQVDPGNARLRDLLAGTIESGAWQLLWIPPTFPYYQLQGPFADPGLRKFTKRLVFSSWRVVPKAIATLLSYEAERRMILSFEPKARNTAEARKRRAPLLRFARSEGRLTGMPVLGLIYPCSTLAAECDPLTLIAGETASNLLPTIEAVLDRFRGKIEGLLKEIKLPVADEGSSDDWYWAAPILLDLINHREETVKWFEPDNLAAIWAGIDETGNGDRTQPDADGEVGRWGEHVEQARNLVNRFCEGTLSLGPMPADLPTVLANMAIGGLGVVALRSVFRVTHGEGMLVNADLRDAGAQIARAFLTLFNTPESMSLIRGMNAAEPYWERVMQYCVHGGLQSVLDEYAHVLRESLGLIDKPVEVVSSEITSAIHDALALRTSSMTVDSVQVKEDIPQVKMGQFEMRGRFALRFDRDKAEGSPEDTRPQQVRAAFNSPFWPFVLATTSVGQEGLDFHHYCHAVVHWNLPSNPVDLEQREGRVHRYKGHAVRKNLADRHGISTLSKGVRDPWESLFLAGECHRPEDATDLVPYWVYPIEGGARIERHVPALPLSREVERMSALRRSLTVYRMVFGQNRQEDLVNYLLSRVPKTEIESLTQELRVDLSPPTV